MTTGQPVATGVTGLPGETTVTVTNDNVTSGQKAFSFLQAYWGSPYSPASLALNDIVLTSTDLTQQRQQVDAWLTANHEGFDYALFAAVTYWAENDVRAWSGARDTQLFCYDPAPPQPLIPLVLPTASSGTISLKADGTAEFVPASGAAIPLKFAKRTLASAGATQTSEVSLQLIVQDMVLQGGADGTYQAFFTGKQNGEDMIVQPYQGPKLAWWMSAYDLANIVYTAVDVIMSVSAVIALAKNLPAIFNALRTGAQQLLSAVKTDASSLAEQLSSNFTSAAEENSGLVNVDVDVDTDVDVDIDVLAGRPAGLPAGPFLGEQLVGPDPVGVVVGDGRDD